MSADVQYLLGGGGPPYPVGEHAGEENPFERLKGQFLASLNHEIRTPLSGLIGMSDLLAETNLDDDQKEFLAGIRECAGQLLETLNAVLDYSSLSAGQYTLEESEFHLAQILEAIAADSLGKAEEKGLALGFQADEGLPETAIGDARHLRQALSHLLHNAVKFTARGRVDLTAGFEPLSAGRIFLVLVVADTGPGIEPDKLGLLFQSFRQLEGGLARRHSGLGLGLALVDRLARLMRGSIQVESELGSGSRFTLRVPLRLPRGAQPVQQPRRPAAGGRILLVDDNKVAQRLVGHILGQAGYEVRFADDGAHGAEVAAGQPHDLVLMDLQMPDMDGLAATALLRRLPGYENVPVIALTANYSDEHRGLCDQAGLQGFLCKPFEKAKLLEAVRRHLG